MKFLRKFKQLLNPAQVFDLMNGGPELGYGRAFLSTCQLMSQQANSSRSLLLHQTAAFPEVRDFPDPGVWGRRQRGLGSVRAG